VHRNALRQSHPRENGVNGRERLLIRLCIRDVDSSRDAAHMPANDLVIAHQEDGCRIAFANRAELGFFSKPLGLEKGQNVGIDNIGMNRKHAVRVSWIDLESRVLDQLRLKQDGVLVRYDLIVIALHHQGRNVDCL
jgi:hypothetical protein